MATYFTKGKYQTSIISQEFYNKWVVQNPNYSHIDFQKWKRYWKYLREEIYSGVIENSEGVDLPFFLGNISVKILDIDFKCAKDFISSNRSDKITGERIRIPFITSDIPKKPKIVWRKHPLFLSLPAIFGTEIAKSCRKVISAGIRNNLSKYQKAFHHQGVESKCEDVPEPSLFDLA